MAVKPGWIKQLRFKLQQAQKQKKKKYEIQKAQFL
jgi:hypothetical protein